jgi:hypothetical protein
MAEPDPFAGWTDVGSAPAAPAGADPFAGWTDAGPGTGRAAAPAFPSPLEKAQTLVEGALTPFTSYPETYAQMSRESRVLMQEGIDQAARGGLGDVAVGAGKTALGGVGYLTSPINAGLRTIVGRPLENFGLPREYSEFAASLALPALPISKAVSTVASKVKDVFNIGSKINRAERLEGLFSAADDLYEAARASSVQWTPEQIAKFKSDALAALQREGHRDFTAPKTFRALDELSSTEPTNAGDAIAVRKTLGKLTRTPEEADAAGTVMDTLDNHLLSAIPEANDARSIYASAKRAEVIHDAMTRAELAASTSGSGQNLDNTTRQAFKSILQNPKLRRGFSPEELSQMASIARGTFAGNVSRYLGNLLGGGGGVGTTVAAGAGAYALGPAGAAAPVLGYAAKKLGGILTQRQVAKLDALMQREPSIEPALAAWTDAAQQFEIAPVSRNLAGLAVASRGLSDHLGGRGIPVSPGALVRSVTAAPAEEPAPAWPSSVMLVPVEHDPFVGGTPP